MMGRLKFDIQVNIFNNMHGLLQMLPNYILSTDQTCSTYVVTMQWIYAYINHR